jgi:signal transduction histidine kinase
MSHRSSQTEAALLVRSPRIYGASEMAERTRSFDWARTAVGSIEGWPEPLIVIVNTLLASPHPMFLWWGPELLQFYNDAYRRSLGNDKHPVALGQRGEDCWPEVWEIIYPQIQHVMNDGGATWHEDQLVPIYRDGKLEDVYWTYAYSPVRDLEGNVSGVLVTCTETTHKRLAEQGLRRELNRLSELFQQAPAFFALLRGPQHVVEQMNPSYRRLVGSRDLIGKTLLEALPEVEEQGFIDLLDRVYRSGEPFIGRDTPVRLAREGSGELEERTLDFVYQPMREADGTVSGIIVLGIDTTEAKRAEHALLQTEKLAVVGRLASSIAHEINNPLESVTNLIYLAQQTAISPETSAYLAEAEIELRRVAAITNQTLRFHRQATAPKPITSHELIGSTLAIYQGRLSNSRITVCRRDRALQSVLCFDGEIRQVLSNLLGNAIDAMSASGGSLLIRSREGTNWKSDEKGLIFTVADTGPGMSPATVSRIFEPFFTTKGLSGTGLGLWISEDIVKRHHGALSVRSSQSAMHCGTVFRLFLPFNAVKRPAQN